MEDNLIIKMEDNLIKKMENNLINDLDISNFFPHYPLIDHEDFYQKIYEKEEFYKERFKKNDKNVLKHQILIARFLSPYTTYNRLLLFHDPGTGKTCTAVNAYEFFRNEESKEKFIGAIKKKKFNGAVIIGISQTPILDEFKEKIINTCSESNIYKEKEEEKEKAEDYEEDYDEEDYDEDYDEKDYEKKYDPKYRKRKRIIKEVKKHYTFMTIAQVVNKYNSSKKDLLKELSNKVIIVDEAHKLKPSEGEDIKCKECKGNKTINNIECKKCSGIGITGIPSQKKYDIFHDIFHQIKSSKVLLLTGTPIRDKVREIFVLLNLLLPQEKNINLEEDYEKNKNWLNNDFRKIIRGHVSYVKKRIDSRIKVTYVTNGKSKFYESYMQGLQNEIYMKELDQISGGIEKGTLFKQITNLVLPPKTNENKGVYGNDLFKEYITTSSQEKDGHKIIIYESKRIFTSINASKEQKLKELKNYSAKYHDIVKLIMDNPKQKVFVFGEIRVGSGLVMFTKILRQFIPPKTIRLISSVNKNKIPDIIKQFNNPENEYGKNIRVIVGTDITGEGITLKNIEQIHIINPWYNYGKIIQAIARGIRFGSHEDLINKRKGKDIMVNVYLHVSIPRNKKGELVPKDSEDLDLYERSENKDKEIRIVERILKESAIDCQLEYKRNYVDSKNNSKECDYGKCKYKCEGITNKTPIINYTNYELIYSKTSTIIEKIKKLFKNDFSLKIDTIRENLKNYTIFEIIKALNEITTKNLPMKEYKNKNIEIELTKMENERDKLDNDIENMEIKNQKGEGLVKLKKEFEKVIDDLETLGEKYEDDKEKNKNFLKEYKNIYYLSKFIQTPSNSLDVFYEANKISEISKSFFDTYIFDFIQSFIEFLNNVKIEEKEIYKIMEDNLEILDKNIQEIILEEAKISDLIKNETNKKAREYILKYYSKYIHENKYYYISNLLGKDNLKCLNKNEIKNVKSGGNCNNINKEYKNLWKSCNEKFEVKKEAEINIENLKYYGIIEKGEFKIRNVSTILERYGITNKKSIQEIDKDKLELLKKMQREGKTKKEIKNKTDIDVDKRKKTTSKTCKTWHKEDLLKVISNLDIEDYKNEFEIILERTSKRKKGTYKLTVNDDTGKSEIEKFLKDSSMMTQKNIKIFMKLPLDNLRKILFVISDINEYEISSICKFLEKYFREKNLILK